MDSPSESRTLHTWLPERNCYAPSLLFCKTADNNLSHRLSVKHSTEDSLEDRATCSTQCFPVPFSIIAPVICPPTQHEGTRRRLQAGRPHSPYSGRSAPQCLLKFNSCFPPRVGMPHLSFAMETRQATILGFWGREKPLDPSQAAGPRLSEDNTHT